MIRPLAPPPLQSNFGNFRDLATGQTIVVRPPRDWTNWFSRLFQSVNTSLTLLGEPVLITKNGIPVTY